MGASLSVLIGRELLISTYRYISKAQGVIEIRTELEATFSTTLHFGVSHPQHRVEKKDNTEKELYTTLYTTLAIYNRNTTNSFTNIL